MRQYFRGWQRTIWCVMPLLVVTVCFFTSLYLWHRRSQSVTGRVLIDPGAFAAIDQGNLEPPLREFVQLLDSPKKVIGLPTTNFAELFALSLKVENGGSIDRYDFVVASTPEQQQRLSRHGGQVPCWPMMRINVDSKSQTIRSVTIYDQCL